MKFGGNPCRDVERVRFYIHIHPQTHTYTNEIIYKIIITIIIIIIINFFIEGNKSRGGDITPNISR